MPYITSSTTGEKVWSYAERDQVINWFSDQYRTAAEKLARRTEEYLFDRQSPYYQDPLYLSWAVAMFDREKTGSGGYIGPYDPERASVQKTPVKPHQQFSAADVEVHVPEAAHEAGYVKSPEGDA